MLDSIAKIDSFASDMYSLGITLLELIKLDLPMPVRAYSSFNLEATIVAEVESVPYSDYLKDMLMGMLRIDPRKRPIIEELNLDMRMQLGKDIQRRNEVDWENMSDAQLAAEEVYIRHVKETLEKGSELDIEQRRRFLAQSLMALSRTYFAQNRPHQAEEHIKSALSLLPESHINHYSVACSQLASIYSSMGLLSEASDFAAISLTTFRDSPIVNEHTESKIYTVMAGIYQSRGLFSDAIDCARTALRLSSEANDPNTGDIYATLAVIYKSMGKLGEAGHFANKSLRLMRDILGEDHPKTGVVDSILAGICKDKGELRKAEDFARRSLEIDLTAFGVNHLKTAKSFINFAGIEIELEKFSEAEEYSKKSLSVFLDIYRENHSLIATAYNHLSAIYRKTARITESLTYAKKALCVSVRMNGEIHPLTASIYNNISGVYLDCNEAEKAKLFATKSLSIAIKLFGDIHPCVATAYSSLSVACFSLKKLEEAEHCLLKALRIQLSTLGEQHADVAGSYHNLSVIYAEMGDVEKGIQYGEMAVAGFEGQQTKRAAGAAYLNLARLYNANGGVSEAKRTAKKSKKIYQMTLGKLHPKTVEVEEFLSQLKAKI